jgi:uncharacterized coiled-coil protein SlyX
MAVAAQDGWEYRMEALEARVKHLEAALEGLQDAVYRQAQLGEEKHEELRRRMEPGQMAIDLAEDARRRGL